MKFRRVPDRNEPEYVSGIAELAWERKVTCSERGLMTAQSLKAGVEVELPLSDQMLR